MIDQDLFSRVLAAISQGVLIAGPDMRILHMNAAFEAISGYDAADMVGRNCRILQGPETDRATVDAIRQALVEGRPFAGEILNYKKNGEKFWNDLSITPIRDAGGLVAYFIGVTRDVTQRKDSELSLVRLQAHYHFLFDHVQSGIVLHAANTEILFINAWAAELLGVDQHETLGVGTTDPKWVFVREDGSRMPLEEFPVNRAVASRGEVRNLILGQCRLNDGSVVWLMCNADPVMDAAGKLESVVVSFTDVTELKQTERALQKSEERLQLVMRGANDGAWDWDLVRQETYYSPRWWQMLGYEPNELTGDALLWERLVHPRERRRVHSYVGAILSDTRTSYEMEFRLRHKDGHYVPVLSRGFILRGGDGQALRVSGTIMDLTERKRAEEQINRLAFYDVLTGLPNRQLLTKMLKVAVEGSKSSGEHGALLFIDLDNFKVLNDTQGHYVGDTLLQMVARRLRRCVRRANAVARVGGDEFVVIVENVGKADDVVAEKALTVAKNISDALRTPFALGGTRYSCTLSIGVVLFGAVGTCVESILKQADLAMYQAKAEGKNAIRLFDATMQTAVEDRLALETDLRKALNGRQMVLYAQPQVNDRGTVTGAEMLLRWRHPKRGLLSPMVFVPVAESTGLILPIGEWVLRTTCRQLADWAADPRLGELSLSVNVSVRQIRESNFVQTVEAVLTETRAPATKLKLELTESLLAEDVDDIVAKMTRLRALGVMFSLDDFGTGYSSLSYLQRMPLDELKIDRAFVQKVLGNKQDAAIARIIISLAKNLGLKVIAEGVETDGQREFLAHHGCGNYQGYLFGRPVSLEEFAASLQGMTALAGAI